ncbi:MAG: chemotaxis protein CheX [Fibrobacteria bacterium]|nr:chemotaxis protein CheX [Fibrobacteria bacterium]
MDDARLISHTLRFTSAVRDCFRDMLGVEMPPVAPGVEIRDFSPSYSMVAMIHFTGAIQGDFAISLDETTAARLIGAWSEGMDAVAMREVRPDFGGMLKELLNTAVGQSLPALEEEVGRLAYHPPLIVYGELDAPAIPSGNLTLEADAGPLACCVVLDEAGSDAERMLKQAVADLRRAREEVESCTRVLDDLLQQSRTGRLPEAVRLEAERVLLEVRVHAGATGDSFLFD